MCCFLCVSWQVCMKKAYEDGCRSPPQALLGPRSVIFLCESRSRSMPSRLSLAPALSVVLCAPQWVSGGKAGHLCSLSSLFTFSHQIVPLNIEILRILFGQEQFGFTVQNSDIFMKFFETNERFHCSSASKGWRSIVQGRGRKDPCTMWAFGLEVPFNSGI